MEMSIYDKASNLYNQGQFKKAYKKFHTGHLNNDFYCSLGMLKCMLLGHGVTKNIEAVISSIKQYETELINKHECKEIEATYYLAFFLDQEIIDSAEYNVLSLIKILTRKKHKMALTMLGDFYYEGKYLAKSISKAKTFYKAALENGCLLSAAYLGEIYFIGDGCRKNLKNAFRYFEILEKSEISNVYKRLSECYYYGYGVSKDYSSAINICNKLIKIDKENGLKIILKYYVEKENNELILKYIHKLKNYDKVYAYEKLFSHYIDIEDVKRSKIYLNKLLQSDINEANKVCYKSIFISEFRKHSNIKYRMSALSVLESILNELDYSRLLDFIEIIKLIDEDDFEIMKKCNLIAEIIYEKLSNIQFYNKEERIKYAELCFICQKYDKGIKILETLVQKKDFIAARILGDFYNKGVLSYKEIICPKLKKDLKKALYFYNLFGDKENKKILFELYYDQEDYNNAIKNIDDYIDELDIKDRSVLYYKIGKCYLHCGDVDTLKAITYLKKSDKLNYRFAPIELAKIYFEKDDFYDSKVSLKYFKRYIKTNIKFLDEIKQLEDPFTYKVYCGTFNYLVGIEFFYNTNAPWYNPSKSIFYLKSAYDYGLTFAAYYLGKYYFDKGDISNALYWYKKDKNNIKCLSALGNYYNINKSDEIKALKYYETAISLYEENPSLINNNMFEQDLSDYIKEIYYNAAYIYYLENEVIQDFKKSLEYFKKAKSLGYNCDYAIEMVNSELGIKNEDNYINQFARGVIFKQTNINNYPKIIEREFSKDFSNEWNTLSKYSKDAIVVGMFNYLSCYFIEKENQNLNIDYSPTITQYSKALEYETKNIFYSGYINYLIENNISPELFENKNGFTQKREGKLIFKEQYGGYTLGSLKHIIGVNKKNTINSDGLKVRIVEKYVIDDIMLDYCDKVLFREDAFSIINRRKEIVHYLISLSSEVSDIVNFYRNPSAHCGKIMYRSKAETCGNWIIKGRKILKKLLEKVKQ